MSSILSLTYDILHPSGHDPGPPVPEGSPTIGIKLNHFCVRIRDPTHPSTSTPPSSACAPLPQHVRHRLDSKLFGIETFAKLVYTLGLLELYNIHGTKSDPEFKEYSTGSTPPTLGFYQYGFSVPDVEAQVERLRKEGVELKELGVRDRRSIPINAWEEEEGYAKGPEIHDNYRHVFEQIAFVKDLDGYIIELVPQNIET